MPSPTWNTCCAKPTAWEVHQSDGDRYASVNLNVAVTVAALDPPSSSSRNGRLRTGYVVVLEDLSDILHAQKQTAWREVARRIAHEIKNPLTPLALSAERIQRHLERGNPPMPRRST